MENKKIENTEKKPDKRLLNLRPPFKKGEVVPNCGRKVGQRNYNTIRREALIAIGKKNGKTAEEIENMLIEVGLSSALRGDFRYYKDDLDRKYGQAKQAMDLTSNGEQIGALILPIKNVGNTKKYENRLEPSAKTGNSVGKD